MAVPKEAQILRKNHPYWIAKGAKYVPEARGKKIGYTELAMHTRQADKRVSHCWKGRYNYGYCFLEDGSFLHGHMNIHPTVVNLSGSKTKMRKAPKHRAKRKYGRTTGFFDGAHCRDKSGMFVPVTQCRRV